MMRPDVRLLPLVVTGLLTVVPSGANAQCRLDLVESGIQSYRDLALSDAAVQFSQAIAANESSQCGTANARALVYLGATHWLSERPDSAARAFERAVIQAPRYRPDPVEFPPAVTELFERVRRDTPAVAATLPEEVELGPRSDPQALSIHLTASTDHRVAVAVRSLDVDVLTLYDGIVRAGPRGAVVEWDGRDAEGTPVESGWYDLEIVSADEEARPVRKLVIALSIESDVPEPELVEVFDTVDASPGSSDGRVWKAIVIAGAGLAGGAAIVAMPSALDAGSGSWFRYPIAGSVGVAGIVGFFQRLGDGEPGVVRVDTTFVPAGPAPPPTLRIRAAYERRVEIDALGTGAGRGSDP